MKHMTLKRVVPLTKFFGVTQLNIQFNIWFKFDVSFFFPSRKL